MENVFNKYCLFSALYLLFMLYGCNQVNMIEGNGTVTSQSKVTGSFEEISIVDNYQVLLEKSIREEVLIEADENLHEYIAVEVKKGKLIIKNTTRLKGSEPVKITIFYQNIHGIDVSGAALINNNDVLKSNDLEMELSGAGIINLELECSNLNLALSGAGMITLQGYANSNTMDLSGAGNLDAGKLVSKKCKVQLSGFGSAVVHATESLKAEVDGAGVIKYYGNPAKIDKKVDGLGNVMPAKKSEEKESI